MPQKEKDLSRFAKSVVNGLDISLSGRTVSDKNDRTDDLDKPC